MNRGNARDFSRLSEYAMDYQPGASRYTVGEASNFTLMPMLQASLDQLLLWTPDAVQDYARELNRPIIKFITEQGGEVESFSYLAEHLIAPKLPQGINVDALKKELELNRVYVSVRGEFLRISINVFNEPKDLQVLMDVIGQELISV